MKNDILKKFGKDSLVYLPGQIFIGISGFITIIIYTRLFSTSNFGDYSLISGAVGFFITVLTGWLSQSTLRYYDDYLNKGKFISTIINSFIMINFFVMLLGIGGFFIFQRYMNPIFAKLVLFGLILFLVQSLYTILQSMLRSERMTKVFSINDIIISCSQVFLVYLLVYFFSFNVESIIISLVIGYSIAVLISITSLKLFKNFSLFVIDFNILKELLRYGFPLLGITFTSWVLTLSDRYLIKIFGSSSDVGLYTINYSIAYNTFNLFITLLMMGAFPLIIKTWNTEGVEETELVISNMIKYFLAITIPAFFGVLSLSKDIMLTFGTEEYASGHYIIPIIALGMLFLGVSQYTNKIWELQKNTKIILYFNIIIAIINVFLNILLIPVFGYIAAALTTTISYFIYLLISIIKSYRIFKVKVDIFSLLIIIFSSIIMTIIINKVNLGLSRILSLLVTIIIGMAVYFILWCFLDKLRVRLISKFKK